MRILHLHDEPWDSGIAHYALTLAAEQKRRGHRVFFWSREAAFAAQAARDLGLECLEVASPWRDLAVFRERALALGVEIINAHTGSSQAWGAALALGGNVPLVRTRADARPTSRHFFSRFMARRTAAFIAANSRIAAELSLAFPGARVATVLPGLPDAAAPALAGEPVVGILGRLDPVKGHETFLEAAAMLREEFPLARFLAAGAGEPARMEELGRKSRSLGLEGKVEWLGKVPDAFAFIASCRIGVVASIGSEAVSRAALEWMSAGRPLIAAAVGGIPDLVEGAGLLVAPRAPGALAEALRGLLAAPSRAEELGAKARNSFEARFRIGRAVEETEKVYEDEIRRFSH